MDFITLSRALLRKKTLILATALLTGAMAAVFLHFRKEKYKSTARIATGLTLPDQDQFDSDQQKPRNSDVDFSNLLTTMNSPVIFNLLSYRLLLHDLDTVGHRFRDPKRVDLQSLDSDTDSPLDHLQNLINAPFSENGSLVESDPMRMEQIKKELQYKVDNLIPLETNDPNYNYIRALYLEYKYDFSHIRDATVITRIPNSDFVQVEFTSENKYLSAYAVNTFCSEFIRYYDSLRNHSLISTVRFLKQLTEKKKEQMDSKLDTLKTFSSSNTDWNISDAGTTRMQQLTTLENTHDELQGEVDALDLNLKRLREEKDQESTGEGYYSKNAEIIKLQRQISALSQTQLTTGSNAAIADSLNFLESRMRDLLAEVDANPAPNGKTTLDDQIAEAEVNIQADEKRISAIEGRIRNLKYGLSRFASRQASQGAIQSEADLASQEYLDIVNRYNEAKNKLAAASTVHQVLFASPPVTPASPRWTIVVILAVLGGGALAIFIIIFSELFDSTIRTPEIFRQRIPIPLLGIVTRAKFRMRRRKKKLVNPFGHKISLPNQTQLRSIRHQITTMNDKVYLFTSLKPGEGKTFLIISLAHAFSLINKRILIIDANFKTNTLTQIYGDPKSQGRRGGDVFISPAGYANTLFETAEGDNSSVYHSESLVMPTKYKGLFFVGGLGTPHSSPDEILPASNFQNFMTLMRRRFDYIFVESAALNESPDALELTRYVDKVNLVVSAGNEVGVRDQQSINYLVGLNGKLGGAILNKVRRENAVG